MEGSHQSKEWQRKQTYILDKCLFQRGQLVYPPLLQRAWLSWGVCSRGARLLCLLHLGGWSYLREGRARHSAPAVIFNPASVSPLSRYRMAGERGSQWVSLSICYEDLLCYGAQTAYHSGSFERLPPDPTTPPTLFFTDLDHMAKPSGSPHVHWADLLSSLLPGPTGESLCCWGSHPWEGFPFPLDLRLELWRGGICSRLMPGRFTQSLQATLEFFVPQSASYRVTPGTMEVGGDRGG